MSFECCQFFVWILAFSSVGILNFQNTWLSYRFPLTSHGWLKTAILCLQTKLLFLLALFVMAWTSVSGRETQIHCCYDKTIRQQKNLHVIIKYTARTSTRMITTNIATHFLEQQLLPTEGQKKKILGQQLARSTFPLHSMVPFSGSLWESGAFQICRLEPGWMSWCFPTSSGHLCSGNWTDPNLPWVWGEVKRRRRLAINANPLLPHLLCSLFSAARDRSLGSGVSGCGPSYPSIPLPGKPTRV